MWGLINLNKPTGISSRQAINQIQRRIRPVRIGHAGTLDPLAQGVLVVLVGPATRLTSRVQEWPKIYRGTFLLGRHSDTEDVEGNVCELPDAPIPTRGELDEALRMFRGVILQQPPVYSALKVKGQRAYAMARAGEQVNLAARQVSIHDLSIVRYEYPELELHVVCGSGTYIRSLGRDIARAVNTEAVMSALTRTAIGHLDLDSAAELDQIEQSGVEPYLLPAVHAVQGMPQVMLTTDQEATIRRGMSIVLPGRHEAELAAIRGDGELAALLAQRGPLQYGPKRNFLPQATEKL
jgi:tRNA pseudouridine55 synthase